MMSEKCCGEGEGSSVCCFESDVVRRSDGQGLFRGAVVRSCKKASGMVGEEVTSKLWSEADEVL
jgi:hypothetical protein